MIRPAEIPPPENFGEGYLLKRRYTVNENVKRIAKSRLWIALLIVTACGLAAGLYACFTRIPGSTARIVCATAIIAITAPSIFGYAKIRSNTAPYKGAIVLGGMHRFLFIIGIIGALAGLVLFFELLVIPSAAFLMPVSLLPICGCVLEWNLYHMYHNMASRLGSRDHATLYQSRRTEILVAVYLVISLLPVPLALLTARSVLTSGMSTLYVSIPIFGRVTISGNIFDSTLLPEELLIAVSIIHSALLYVATAGFRDACIKDGGTFRK